MSPPSLLPLAAQPRERADAARNRDALLDAAVRLVAEHGVDCVTMETVAAEAGVGKGTLFRRYGSRAGLMAAILDQSEATFQGRVLSGPPPLGPGAPPLDRLLAFGPARLRQNLAHAELLIAAEAFNGRAAPGVHAFGVMHVRHLLEAVGTTGDLPVLAGSLLAPLDITTAVMQVEVQHVAVERVEAAWVDLVRRVAGQ